VDSVPIQDSYQQVVSASAPVEVVSLPPRIFVTGCTLAAAGIFLLGGPAPVWLLAAEVLSTILALFFLGSFKYQVHKNALTYGMLLVIVATFCRLGTSEWHAQIRETGWWAWARLNVLSFRGLDELVHADTMLFILGLTFFVSVIAQTRLLEGITFTLLRHYQGAVVPTVISVIGFVAIASGIFDGVSMIGLTVRTLVIILLLAAAPMPAIRYAVIVCTFVTTVCGTWLAYGEPPNLIMKANLYPQLGNAFFLLYCAPGAVVCYLLIARELRKRLRDQRVFLELLDVVEAKAQDVRFLQATRHGEVLTPVEFVEDNAGELGGHADGVLKWLRQGESLGIALFREKVAEDTRKATSSAKNWPTPWTATISSFLPATTTEHGRPNAKSTRPWRRRRNCDGGRKRLARLRSCRLSACSSCMESIIGCRYFSLPSRGLDAPCWEL